MQVQEIMTRKVECCTPDTDLRSIAKMMAECDCGSIPVVENMESMKPVGMVTDRDIVVRAVARGQNPLELRAGDCMSTPVRSVSPQASLDDCIDMMEEFQIRRMPVVDDGGRIVGIIAQADIAETATTAETAELLREVSQPEHGQQWQRPGYH